MENGKDDSPIFNFEDLDKVEDKIEEILPEHSFTGIVISPRGGGKTHLSTFFTFLLNKIRRYTSVFLFSETAKIQDAYNFIPKQNRFTNLDNLEQLLEMQYNLIKKNKKKGKNVKRVRSTILLIFDDIINADGFKSNKVLKDVFVLGRHYKDQLGSLVDTLILSQNYSSIGPIMRKNSNFVLHGRLDSYSDRKAIIESYLSSTNTRKQGYTFVRALNAVPYAFLLIFHTKSNKLSMKDYAYSFLAPSKLPKFKIGSKRQWEISSKINLDK